MGETVVFFEGKMEHCITLEVLKQTKGIKEGADMSIMLDQMPKLGFGMMRLPERDGAVDHERVCRMVDQYMQAGMNYFDTAYVYHGGKSEVAAKEA